MFCFAKLKANAGDGIAPSLPEVDGFIVLAGGRGEGAWTLCDVHLVDPRDASSLQRVSQETLDLLSAGEGCPVSVALANSALRRIPAVTHDVVEFEGALCKLLRFFLDLCERGAFIRTTSRVDESLYREKGDRIWSVSSRGESITWVSSDFQLYTDPADQFELSTEDLKRLPEKVPLPLWLVDPKVDKS